MNRQTILDSVQNKQRACADRPVRAGNIRLHSESGQWLVETPSIQASVELNLTQHAESQLLNRLGIPGTYFHKCANELRAENANYWLQRQRNKKYLVRLMDGRVRAIFSTKFSPELDDHKVFPIILRHLEQAQPNLEYHSFDYDNNVTILQVLFPDISTQHEDQEYIAGLHIINSEVGMSALWVKPMILIRNRIYAFELLSKSKSGSTRIIHVGDITPEDAAIAVDRAVEAVQYGIRTAIVASQAAVENPTEEIKTIIAENNFIPARLYAMLEDEYRAKQLATKLEIAQSILRACSNLPLFQKYQAEAEVGQYLNLFDDRRERLEDILGV